MVRDRRSLPLQVSEEIRGMLSGGGLHPGDQLPTEAELAARFDVGRTTIREALKLLEQDGLVDVRHGLGRFVAAIPSVVRPVTSLESVTEMMTHLGYVVSNRVLSVTEGVASDEEAQELQLAQGATVIRLERLRIQGEDPLIYSVDVLPADLLSGPASERDWTGSLLDVLDREGFRVVSASAQIRAVTLPRSIGRRAGLDSSRPWLLMVQLNVTEVGRPVIYSRDYHRGDAFTFHVLRRRSS
jgi:GntR family transcriptional regulator